MSPTQQPRSQSVSRVELYSQQSQPVKQVSFSSKEPRRAQSSMRALGTPRHLSRNAAAVAPSTGRAGSEPGAAAESNNKHSFSLDYDDPEEVTRAILRLREQRERDAAERRPSRTRSRGKSRDPSQPSSSQAQVEQQQSKQQRPTVLEPKQAARSSSTAIRQKELQHLQQTIALQKSHSQGSSQQSSGQNAVMTSTTQMYRSPSPSLAQRQTQAPAAANNGAQQQQSSQQLQQISLQQSSSSTENHYQQQQQSKVNGDSSHPYRRYPSSPHGQQSPQQHASANSSPQQPYSATPRMANGQQPTRASSQLRQPQLPTLLTSRPKMMTTADAGGSSNQAKQRSDGLMAELDELRFFQELDTDPSNVAPTKVLGATMRAVSPANHRTLPSSNGNAPRVPLLLDLALGNGGGNSDKNRLPPPPPVNFMDPRIISKLDRHTLELETQKMVRSVQLLTTEKLAIEAEIEILNTNEGQHKKRVQQLEQALSQVQLQLMHAKKEMEAFRTNMVQQYESKLSENVEKLQQTQQLVDGLKGERESLRSDLEKRVAQMNELKKKAKAELRSEREAAQAREAVLELQLSELMSTVEELKLKVREKDFDVDGLRQQVRNAQQALIDASQQQEDSHRAQLDSLQEQVSLAESNYMEAVKQREQVQEQLESHQKELELVSKQSEEQSNVIADLTNRLNQVHHDYRQKLGELKDSYEAKEKRRLSEMVVSQSKQVEEYERRLMSMQQQLTMATDRHHAEIRQKELDVESNLERERKRVREQLEDEHYRASEQLRIDLETTRRDYTEAENERQRLRKAYASPNQELTKAQKSWETKDDRRQQEITQLRQQIERLEFDSSDKDTRILDLTRKMSEKDRKHDDRLNEMESKYAANLAARDELLAEQKRKVSDAEIAAKNEIARKEKDSMQAKTKLESLVSKLETDLAHAKTSLELSCRGLQDSERTTLELLSVRASLASAQAEASSDRQSHERVVAEMKEEIVALERELRTAETRLHDKTAEAEEMALSHKIGSEELSSSMRETQIQAETLRVRLSEMEIVVTRDRAIIDRQATDIAQLERQRRDLLVDAEQSQSLAALNEELQVKVKDLEDAIATLQLDSRRLASDNETLKQLRLALIEDKTQLETKVSELEAAETILRQENDELQESSDVIEANIRKLRQVNEELQAKMLLLPQAHAEIAQLNQTISSLDDEKCKTSAELAQVRQELESSSRRVDDCARQLEKATQVTADFEKRAQQTAELVKSLEGTLESEQLAKAALKEELEKAKRDVRRMELESVKICKLDDQLKRTSSSQEALQEDVQRLTTELDIKSMHIAELKERLQELMSSRDALREQLKRADTELATTSQHVKEMQEQNASGVKVLEEKVAELRSSAAKQQDKFNELAVDSEKKSQRMKELLVQHSSEVAGLDERIVELTTFKATIEAQMRALEAELGTKTERLERLETTLSELRESDSQVLKESDELRSKLHRTEAQLKECELTIGELESASNVSSGLQAEVKMLRKAKSALEAKLSSLRDEQADRELHVQQTAERYSNQIVALQMQVEDLTAAKASLKTKLTEAEDELERSSETLRLSSEKHSADLATLRQRVAEQLEVKNKLDYKIEELTSQLAQVMQDSQAVAEKRADIEGLQNQVDASMKENRSLKLRISDVEQELERKEKQIKDVVNRYSQEVAVLNDKLEHQTKANRNLQKELDHASANSVSRSAASDEARSLQDRVASLEKSVDVERALTHDAEKAKRRVEKELAAMEASKKDLHDRFEKVTSERNEVISALEEVIHEVQSREDEIDALADALKRREDELEHAKMIASKALASAQEIKSRYSERGPGSSTGRDRELEDEVASLAAALGQANKTNGSLRRKLARLEEDLTKKEGEYSELMSQMEGKEHRLDRIDQYVSKRQPSEPHTFTYNESASTAASTVSEGTHALDSPSRSLGFADTLSEAGAGSDPWVIQPISTSSTDSTDSVSFPGARAESAGDNKSMDRIALGKYIRKRYMNARSASSTN